MKKQILSNLGRNYFLDAAAYACVFSMSAVLLTGCSAGAPTADPVSRSGFYFNTVVKISLYEYSGQSGPILDDCMDMCRDYENMFSATVEGSDIWNINSSPGQKVSISSDTYSLLNTALDYCRESDGKLDITLGDVTSLWNFSEEAEKKDASPPDPDLIEDALSHVDYNSLKLTHSEADDKYYACLSDPDAKVELGFIAKGYIADRLYELMTEEGVTGGIINLGGNIRCIGTKPDGQDFTVGIQKPFGNMGEYITQIKVSDCSVVSSGVYERCYYYNGKLYHHIIDPSTGYPVETDIYGVSVITQSSTDADALSTLCLMYGLDEAVTLIESTPDTEAVFITDDMEIVKTSGLQ